ncbi:acyl-CoA dehydrogenase [Cereibacter changlensis]|uniref:acyl-CoA dehydrogenase n=1 Tax=Cereibacter changlensis TaxID=402884 RepID=UPI0040341236
MPYRAPLADFRFLLSEVVGFAQVAATERFAEATPETVEAVLGEAGKLCEEVLAPLQRSGDIHPARLENGVVRTSPGFAEGYRAIVEGGWVSIAASPDHGGMGLPMTVTTAVNEMMASACLSLQLNPLMTQGQIEALEHHASDDLKALYLPKLVSGEWCGTMNLTEPQAGSDVGALRTRAEPLGDGSYAVTGQKIYISWADNDFTGNVCHLVLARLPDGAAGTKGISLFLVPKFLPDAEGNPGKRNSLSVVSLEHKMGLHGSPTAVMEYDGAVGWLVGAPHRGMAAMFTMMNNARLGVGVQGIGVAEAATQAALGYALERRQGGAGTIIEHADVRRMLAVMKAETFSARAIALACAVAIDMARATGSAEWQARAALLTPIAKAYGTAMGVEVADLGVQVHGGTGFIEATGAAQYLRDVRVTAIYEGTNGIQAMDLVGRKMMDGGEAAFRLLQEVQDAAEVARHGLPELAGDVWDAAEALREATEALVAQGATDRNAGAVPYLRAFARVLGAHYHLTAAAADPARLALARVAIRRLLPEHAALLAQVREGAEGLFALSAEDLAA